MTLQDLLKKGIVRPLSDLPDIDFIPFGLYTLDYYYKGIPRGRITVIYGPQDVGKTALMLHVAAKNDISTLWIDCENRLTADWVRAWGVNEKNFVVAARPETIENAAEIAKAGVDAGADLIVLDGGAALLSQHDIDKKATDSTSYALGAKAMNWFVRYMTAKLQPQQALVIIQQAYISPQTGTYELAQGRGQKFQSSLMLFLRPDRAPMVEDTKHKQYGGRGTPVGKNVLWIAERCKYAPMGRRGAYTIYFDDVPDPEEPSQSIKAPFITDALLIREGLLEAGQLKQSGSWYNLWGKKVQGADAAAMLIYKYYDDIVHFLRTAELPDWAEVK